MKSKVRALVLFQSTPAIAGGRTLPPVRHWVEMALFQSTPAIAGGRTPAWVLPSLRSTRFQSTPAIAGGRTPSNWRATAAPGCFNPRPPLLAGEPVSKRSSSSWFSCFNPRPPLLAGEPIHPARHRKGTSMFQSTPAIAGGRTRLFCGGYRVVLHVSIHARHCWRANPMASLPLRKQNNVSIHATPGVGFVANNAVSIHARHCWRANPPVASQQASHPQLFQSTPAIAGGRTRGDRFTAWSPVHVSIHARHCWRANPTDDQVLEAQIVVSIHARHCWRANPVLPLVDLLLFMSFNPRPPLLAGEPMSTSSLPAVVAKFQSTPAIAGGRTLRHPMSYDLAPLVSIHARHCWRANPR